MLRISKKYDSIMYLLFVLSLISFSCKTKHVDSEPSFKISFIKGDIFKIKKFCFKKIYGKDHVALEKNCIDTVDCIFEFPIDINDNNSVYIFEQSRSTDTLEVRYDVSIGRDNDQFKAIINNFRIGKTTFDSLSIQQNSIPNPNEVESITVYL